MLIVEGADLVGKTTLCRELVKQLDAISMPHDYSHLSKRTTAWQAYEESPVPLYLARASRFTVQDRFHMSDPIYAEARADGLCIEPDDYALVDGWLRGRLGMMTVLMIDATNGDLIRSRWREGETYDLDKVLSVNRAYQRLASSPAQMWNGYHMPFDWLLPVGTNMIDSLVVAQRIVREYVYRQTRLDLAIRHLPRARGL